MVIRSAAFGEAAKRVTMRDWAAEAMDGFGWDDRLRRVEMDIA